MGHHFDQHPEQQKELQKTWIHLLGIFIFNQCYLWCGTSDHPE